MNDVRCCKCDAPIPLAHNGLLGSDVFCSACAVGLGIFSDKRKVEEYFEKQHRDWEQLAREKK